MARSPLIIDSHLIGRLYAIDLGGGGIMLLIEQDGQAISLPLDTDEAKRLGQYLRPLGKPAGSSAATEDDLRELVALYVSDEAEAFDGSKANYVASRLGVTPTTVYSRLKRAEQLGMIDR